MLPAGIEPATLPYQGSVFPLDHKSTRASAVGGNRTRSSLLVGNEACDHYTTTAYADTCYAPRLTAQVSDHGGWGTAFDQVRLPGLEPGPPHSHCGALPIALQTWSTAGLGTEQPSPKGLTPSLAT